MDYLMVTQKMQYLAVVYSIDWKKGRYKKKVNIVID